MKCIDTRFESVISGNSYTLCQLLAHQELMIVLNVKMLESLKDVRTQKVADRRERYRNFVEVKFFGIAKLDSFACDVTVVVVGDHLSGVAVIDINSTELNLYRFGAAGQLIYRKRLPLDVARSIHDFGLSQSYVIFYLSPYILNMESLVHGETLMDALRWEPERGSCLLIVSRETGEQSAVVLVGNRYCLHFINCFEHEGRLMVDVLELDHPIYDQYQLVPDLFTGVCKGRPVRFEINVADQERMSTALIDYQLAPDFPSIIPREFTRPYQDFWMLGISATGKRGRKFFDQLAHARWDCTKACDVYHAPRLHYLGGEPIFVGNPDNEKAGAIICQLFDAESQRSSFAIFDAYKVSRGPIAVLRLKQPIHLGFHASFHPAVTKRHA